jgi:hypothetical protein
MAGHSPIVLIGSNIEAAQPIDKMSRDLADRGMAPPPVRIGEAIEQDGRGAGKGDFEVHGQGVIIDSAGHERKKNKNGTLSQSP